LPPLKIKEKEIKKMSKSYRFDKSEKVEKFLEKMELKKERAKRKEKREAKVFA
jgi:hypothetical protein